MNVQCTILFGGCPLRSLNPRSHERSLPGNRVLTHVASLAQHVRLIRHVADAARLLPVQERHWKPEIANTQCDAIMADFYFKLQYCIRLTQVVIADMEFSEHDTEEDRQAKLRTLAIYNL